MLRKDPNYVSMKIRGRTLLGQSTYWLAKDHLLIVDVRFATERYRRFALKDIAALVIRGTRYYWVSLSVGVLILLFLVLALVSVASNNQPDLFVGAIVLGILVGLVVLSLLFHLFQGTTAFCELHTSVQTVRLPGIHRRRKAERFVSALAPAIRAATPSLTPTESINPPTPENPVARMDTNKEGARMDTNQNE